jgi:hypothetical protein
MDSPTKKYSGTFQTQYLYSIYSSEIDIGGNVGIKASQVDFDTVPAISCNNSACIF